MNYRRLALAIGIVALGLSLLAIVSPGLVAFNLDRVLVSGVGGLVLLQAVRVIQARRRDDRDEAVTPDPELPIATPPPGEDLESELERFLDARQIYYRQTRLRKGLREAAVTVLSQYESQSTAEAEAAVEAGTWTDDMYAAAFIGGEQAPTPPLRVRVPNALRRESPFKRGGRHTVDAIAAAAGVPSPSNNDTSQDPRQQEDLQAKSDTESSQRRTNDSSGSDGKAKDALMRATHSTGHWTGVSSVALVGIGVGILVEQPSVLLAGVVGIGYAAYARSSALPPGSVSISRTLSDERPEPGDEVEVTVTITNDSDRLLADLRLIDGVPETLAVTDTSPRIGTALRAGESTSFTYSITARRGVHTFGPTTVITRDLTSAREQERILRAETTLTCIPALRALAEPVPLRAQATQEVGRVETATSGDGIEFYATREYRPGDQMSRIDWNRRARTGELTTVEFRKERAASVVIVVDTREEAYLSPEAHAQHAVDRAVDAAGQLFVTLADAGDRVGIAALSEESCWLAPGSGVDHRDTARKLLATHPAFSPVPTKTKSALIRQQHHLRKRLSAGTQVIFLTPLCDEYGSQFARRLDEHGYPVTVISLDPTASRTTAQRFAQVARRLRLSTLRGTGIPVMDWSWDDSVAATLARFNERWSR
ncbi:DUF58 domain-containing protein [Natronoarchaeum sp. GCM10025703]|uniref:DUF58 domain-containing protein n=1 Tax=unclassified Natronoarchaeum TaxID=2620183 RepID=UPI003610676F